MKINFSNMTKMIAQAVAIALVPTIRKVVKEEVTEEHRYELTEEGEKLFRKKIGVLLGFILLVALAYFINLIHLHYKQQNLPHINDAILSQMREELDSWDDDLGGGGRWENHSIIYNTKKNTVVYTVQCRNYANEIAMNEYCRVVKDIHQKYTREYRKSILIIHPNRKDLDCY